MLFPTKVPIFETPCKRSDEGNSMAMELVLGHCFHLHLGVFLWGFNNFFQDYTQVLNEAKVIWRERHMGGKFMHWPRRGIIEYSGIFWSHEITRDSLGEQYHITHIHIGGYILKKNMA